MRTLFARRVKKPGTLPGSLELVGAAKAAPVRVTLIDYDEKHAEEREVASVEECFEFKEKPTVTWINVDGVHEPGIVEKLGRHYDIHPLVLEDILHTTQRPKVEFFEDYVYVVIRMLRTVDDGAEIEAEQISLIVGPNFVITFQEAQGDVFDTIRERIRSDKGRVRKMGADYLAYSLIDVIVDNYFVILETLGEVIEGVEEELVEEPDRDTLQEIHDLKGQMIFLRKTVWPLREVISRLERGEAPVFRKATLVYLRDVYDHTIQVIDTIEGFRDMLASMLDIYLSSISNRMNEVMKVLTIIATIFIPLTFIAGIYGMNFQYMPELAWKWGYFGALGVMAAVAVTMVYYFRRKGWL